MKLSRSALLVPLALGLVLQAAWLAFHDARESADGRVGHAASARTQGLRLDETGAAGMAHFEMVEPDVASDAFRRREQGEIRGGSRENLLTVDAEHIATEFLAHRYGPAARFSIKQASCYSEHWIVPVARVDDSGNESATEAYVVIPTDGRAPYLKVQY